MITASAVLGVFRQEPAQPGKLCIHGGTLHSIDLQARAITVKASAVSQKFVVLADAEIIARDKPKGELSALMVGGGVQVKYTEDGDAFVAHQISILGLKIP